MRQTLGGITESDGLLVGWQTVELHHHESVVSHHLLLPSPVDQLCREADARQLDASLEIGLNPSVVHTDDADQVVDLTKFLHATTQLAVLDDSCQLFDGQAIDGLCLSVRFQKCYFHCLVLISSILSAKILIFSQTTKLFPVILKVFS